MIKQNENGEQVYYDKNGKEITEGCHVRYASGRVKTVYRTEDGQLGTDATNPNWIKTGRACPCEYGIYPFDYNETEEIEITLKL